jgi:hypothetical protein
MNVVEPGHELTATPPDPEGLSTTVCECGWVSQPGADAQPYLEAREHILSVRAGTKASRARLASPGGVRPAAGHQCVLPGRRAAEGRPQGRP